MKFTHTIIYVQNVTDTVAFYEAALGLSRVFVHEGGDYAEMATGDTVLAFAAEELREFNGFETVDNRADALPAGAEVCFTTDDVQGAYDKAVTAGAVSVKAPTEKPWGQVVAYIRDLNGFLIAFGSPMGEA